MLTASPQSDGIDFYKQVAELLAAARKHAKKQMDSTIVAAYYEIGRMIVEREQHGQKRAQYGVKLIKGLSEYLTAQCGRGFSIANLKNMRQFYQIYMPLIRQSLISESEKRQSLTARFRLDRTHYQALIRVENETARQGAVTA